MNISEYENLSKICRIGGAAVAFTEEFKKTATDFEKLLVARILVEHIEQIEGEYDDSRNRDQMHN
ncbi:MAG: hypothetical protein J6Y57_01010 [Lachnospiraceae bacterium]|nr:hypothetical protein [Lachnospiraceae bacterium]